MEQSYRILIAEDDEPIAELVSMNFSVAGCACDMAADGFRAAELARTVPYDLAILDVMLPGLDGFELFDVMRARDIPVIYLSAKCDTPSKVRGLRMGAEDYVTKPFDVLELLVRAEKVLARRGRTDGSVSLGNVRVSEEERTVLLGGAPTSSSQRNLRFCSCSCATRTWCSRASSCCARSGARRISARRAPSTATLPACAASCIGRTAS